MPYNFPIQQYLQLVDIQPEQYTCKTELLHAIYAKHVAMIPYQNFDIWVEGQKPYWQRKPVDISKQQSHQRILEQKQGGCCYHTVELLKEALEALGYTVERTNAWLLLGGPKSKTLPSIHVILLVTVERKTWLVDPGFGTKSPRSPIELSLTKNGEVELQQDFETFKLVKNEQNYHIEMLMGKSWLSLYEFTITPMRRQSIEKGNYQLTYHPEPIGIRDVYLMVCLIKPKERVRLVVSQQLLDGQMKNVGLLEVFSAEGIKKTAIKTIDEFCQCLRKEFNIVPRQDVVNAFFQRQYSPGRSMWLEDLPDNKAETLDNGESCQHAFSV